MTRRELANVAGVGHSALGNYESGICLPRLDTLERLLDALQIDLRDFAASLEKNILQEGENPRPRYRSPGRGHRGIPRGLKPGAATTDGSHFLATLGQALGWLREEKQLTLHEVAQRAGISESHLSRIERGLQEIKGTLLGNILRALDTDVIELGLRIRLTTLGEELRQPAKASSNPGRAPSS